MEKTIKAEKQKPLDFTGGDVVTDDCGTWARVCREHSKLFPADNLEDYPGNEALCDVNGCSNRADFYVSLG